MEIYTRLKCSGLDSVDSGKMLEGFKQESEVINSVFLERSCQFPFVG